MSEEDLSTSGSTGKASSEQITKANAKEKNCIACFQSDDKDCSFQFSMDGRDRTQCLCIATDDEERWPEDESKTVKSISDCKQVSLESTMEQPKVPITMPSNDNGSSSGLGHFFLVVGIIIVLALLGAGAYFVVLPRLKESGGVEFSMPRVQIS